MKLVVNGIEIDVDNRHVKTPVMWVLRYVVGPGCSKQATQEPNASPRAIDDTQEPDHDYAAQ